VALFRHYFPHPATRDVSGGVSFVLRDPEEYILVKGVKTGMVPQVVLDALLRVERIAERAIRLAGAGELESPWRAK
jgi:hypothetical protein